MHIDTQGDNNPFNKSFIPPR